MRPYVPFIAVLAIGVSCATLTRGPSNDVQQGRLSRDQESHDQQARPVLDATPRGPFGLSMVATADGNPLDIETFVTNDTCGYCHERQYEEMQGSMHSVAHRDRLYRAAAEMALREAGPEVYALCSGCHTPPGRRQRPGAGYARGGPSRHGHRRCAL